MYLDRYRARLPTLWYGVHKILSGRIEIKIIFMIVPWHYLPFSHSHKCTEEFSGGYIICDNVALMANRMSACIFLVFSITL